MGCIFVPKTSGFKKISGEQKLGCGSWWESSLLQEVSRLQESEFLAAKDVRLEKKTSGRKSSLERVDARFFVQDSRKHIFGG